MTTLSTPPNTTRVILAGLIGNVMEWYDFAVYGYFATVIGRLFSPRPIQRHHSSAPSVLLPQGFWCAPWGACCLDASAIVSDGAKHCSFR